MKEINKNFDRKDKRDTLRFLVKHGLTMDEAKRYTQLGMELKMESIAEQDKKMLETNFQAQLFAFRKLRERLLMTDNPANIYDIQKLSINQPIKESVTARLQKAKTRIDGLENDDKQNIILNASKKLTEEELRAIRRREYYQRRVKTKFAPALLEASSTEEEINSPDSPEKHVSAKKLKKRAALARKKEKMAIENLPEWNTTGKNKPK